MHLHDFISNYPIDKVDKFEKPVEGIHGLYVRGLSLATPEPETWGPPILVYLIPSLNRTNVIINVLGSGDSGIFDTALPSGMTTSPDNR